MAIMIPDAVSSETVSNAEKRLFLRFRKELSDSVIVLHSLGLAHHRSKIWGECDFVVISEQGLFVIEVKGGRITCEKGVWEFIKGDGTRNVKYEGPFTQAKTAYFAVIEEIEKHEDLKGILSGFGVIMPNQEFDQTGSEINLDVLMDAKTYARNLGEFIRDLGQYWSRISEEKYGKKPRYPDKGELEKIRQILRPDIRSAMSLLGILGNAEREQIELTDEQCRILARIDNNDRTLVLGSAGTGKTILAVDKMLRLAKSGKRVLYLCYNRLLGEYVSTAIAAKDDSGRAIARSIHAWFAEIIRKAGYSVSEPDAEGADTEEFFRTHADKYLDAMVSLEVRPFDVIVIDEVQDLLSRSYFDAIDMSLNKGLSSGCWHLFYDPLQDIFGIDGRNLLKELLGYGAAQFELTINCRNTSKVAVCTSMISGVDLTMAGAVDGGFNDVVYYDSEASLTEKIDNKIEKLVSDGYSVSDMIILSGRTRANSVLGKAEKVAGYSIVSIDSSDKKKKQITYCTIKRYKGMEKSIVLAVDIEDLLNDSKKLLHYCGLSRARFGLIVFLHEREKAHFSSLARIFGQRQML